MELFWTRSMKERMDKGSDEKREEAMVYELKKIASLQKLKEQGALHLGRGGGRLPV